MFETLNSFKKQNKIFKLPTTQRLIFKSRRITFFFWSPQNAFLCFYFLDVDSFLYILTVLMATAKEVKHIEFLASAAAAVVLLFNASSQRFEIGASRLW